MKRTGACVLLLALGGVGCSPTSLFLSPTPPPPPAVVEAPRPPAVTADEVNEKNAGEKARALEAELNYDATHKPAAPAGG